ncbi:hypothetical protein BGX28_004937 [Mortierella sp. GBA30]|nr:hypothetical protein BGX28_004937 [Mortierella sp. GBA30]
MSMKNKIQRMSMKNKIQRISMKNKIQRMSMKNKIQGMSMNKIQKRFSMSRIVPRDDPSRLTSSCSPPVIDHVADVPTLFALLTVSKAVFEHAVKRLYGTYFLRTFSKPALEKCIALVLWLSPDQDGMLQALRKELKVDYPRKREPYVDYLSYIRDVTFNIPYFCRWSVSVSSHTPIVLQGSNLTRLIAKAIYFHRLPEIDAIRLEGSDDYRRISKHVKALSSLKRIVIDPSNHDDWAATHDFIKQFIGCHGDAGRSLSLEFESQPPLSQLLLKTLSLLDPPSQSPTTIWDNNFAHCAAHYTKMDLSQIKSANLSHSDFVDHSNLWAKVLSRCRQLERLHLYQGGSGQTFDWAVRACRAGMLRVPLKELDLIVDDYCLHRTLNDILEAFGSTLEKVRVATLRLWDEGPPNNLHLFQPRIASGLYLPKLRELEAETRYPYLITFNPTRMPYIPQLEVLKLGRSDLEHDEEGATAFDSKLLLMIPFKVWPICEFPKLRELQLSSRAAAEFNPLCFQHMPCLESLQISLDLLPWEEHWPAHLWTWDWHMDSLKTLKLSGWSASSFRFRGLRYMPILESLDLSEIGEGNLEDVLDRLFLLYDSDERVVAGSTSPSTSTSTSTVPASFTYAASPAATTTTSFPTKLSSIHLEGMLFIGPVEWGQIFHPTSFPGLKRVYLDGYMGLPNTELIVQASHHPTLQELTMLFPEQGSLWEDVPFDPSWKHCSLYDTKPDAGYLLFQVDDTAYRIPRLKDS